jgi:hypothetical protein
MKKKRPKLTRPLKQIAPIGHGGASGDNPSILEPIEAIQPIIYIATIDDSKIEG